VQNPNEILNAQNKIRDAKKKILHLISFKKDQFFQPSTDWVFAGVHVIRSWLFVDKLFSNGYNFYAYGPSGLLKCNSLRFSPPAIGFRTETSFSPSFLTIDFLRERDPTGNSSGLPSVSRLSSRGH